jgi:hypothetical protein
MSSGKIKGPQDMGAAIVFIVIGVAGLVFGQDLAFGTSAKMGPGYFPTILSALILLLGAGLLVHSFIVAGPRVDPVQFRPLFFIVLSILAFGFLLELLGLALSSVIMTLLAACAGRGMKFRENLALGIGLAVFAVLVFVYGLSQPLPIGWWAS